MSKIIDIKNKRFGKLVAIKLDHIEPRKSGGTNHYWLCQCDCGKKVIVRKNSLLLGYTKSCGCLQRDVLIDRNATHNLSKTRLYKRYRGMVTRCYNSNSLAYKNYGGRGIKICDEWKNDFMSFYNWAINNGYQDNLSLDRINNNGDYEPSNCKWVTAKEQSRNQRTNVLLTYNGETHCLKDWSEILNINYSTLKTKIKTMSLEDLQQVDKREITNV